MESVPAFPGLTISGFTNAPNAGIVFSPLKPFDERRDAVAAAGAIAAALNQQVRAIQDAFIAVSAAAGAGPGHDRRLQAVRRGPRRPRPRRAVSQTQNLIAKAQPAPGLAGVFSGFQVNVPQIGRGRGPRESEAGVPLQNLFDTMQIYLGSLYVNDFNRFGRTYQVNAQADSQFRLSPRTSPG